MLASHWPGAFVLGHTPDRHPEPTRPALTAPALVPASRLGPWLRRGARGLVNTAFGPKRALRVHGMGAAKTGTHTLGEMFADRVPSAHERDAERLIALLLDAGPGSPALRRYLQRRDRWRGLQIDASQVNIYLIGDLEALFPDSRYVLTLRSPAAWLRSMVDDSLRRETSATWHRFRDFRFGPRAAPDGARAGGSRADGPEAALAEAGLYTLDGYLGYWAFAVTEALDRLPADRLLVLRTEEIGPRAAEIARFAAVPDPDRPPRLTHAFRNPWRSGVLSRIDRAYLQDRLATVCGPAAARVMPGWTAAADLDRALAAPAPEAGT